MSEHRAHRTRKELLPVRAAQLVHTLAAVEQAVVVPVAVETERVVIDFEAVLHQPLAGALGLERIVKAGVPKRKDACPRRAPARAAACTDRVAKRAIILLESSAHVADCIVDRLLRHVEAGIARRREEHQVPAGHRKVRIAPIEVIDVTPAALVARAILWPALHFERRLRALC